MFEESQVNLIVTDGGMGDLIGALVAVDWLIRNNPRMMFFVWCPDYLVDFADHVLPKKRRLIRSFKEERLFKKDFATRTTQWTDMNPTPTRINGVDFGFMMLADRLPRPEERNYLQIRPKEIDIRKLGLPLKYVAMQAAFAEPCKTMPLGTANAVIDYVCARKYTPIFIGREESKCGFKDFTVRAKIQPMNFAAGLNFINKTSLLETAAIIAGALCFVGMEGGLTHLAGCTDTQIVAAFSLGDPMIHAAPVRQGTAAYKLSAIVPGAEIKNRFWQTQCSVFDKRDPRLFEGHEKWVAELATSENFIRELERIL